jgi:hypothetical protein
MPIITRTAYNTRISAGPYSTMHVKVLAWFTLLAVVLEFPASEGAVCGYTCYERYRTSCGFWGWDRCTRYRSSTCYRCCSGWTGSTGSGCPTPLCFGSTSCRNGGTCTSPDYCSNCNRGYYSPRCYLCTQIPNCLEEYCSTSNDERCDRCDGDYGSARGSAYKKSHNQRQCIKQCSWRTDSNACYPGTCTNADCSCTHGFSGRDCRNLGSSQAPVFSEHRSTLVRGETTLESPLTLGDTNTVYTNAPSFSHLRVHWKASYQPSGLPARPPYLQRVSLGIVYAAVNAVVNRGPSIVHSVGRHICSTSSTGLEISDDAPATGLVVCDETFTMMNYNTWTPATGDVLQITYSMRNGGYMNLYNRDNHNAIVKRRYVGQTVTAQNTFTYDFVPPHHCLGPVVSCRAGMLDPGNNVITQPKLIVTWDGWEDNLAGVREYHLQVRQLSGSHGDQMTEIFDTPAVYDNVTGPGQNVILPHTGVYSVLMSVVDNAGNVRLTRRFVFYDDDPDDISIHEDSPVRVLSASASTASGRLWQTDLATVRAGATAVRLDWTGHFANMVHHNQGLLKPIGPYVARDIDNGEWGL